MTLKILRAADIPQAANPIWLKEQDISGSTIAYWIISYDSRPDPTPFELGLWCHQLGGQKLGFWLSLRTLSADEGLPAEKGPEELWLSSPGFSRLALPRVAKTIPGSGQTQVGFTFGLTSEYEQHIEAGAVLQLSIKWGA
jgi:hypothetical protein